MASRRAGLAAVGLGLGIAAVAQVASPLATPPLYDGVVVVQPYVYVNPPPGKPGGAQGNSAHLAMNGHASPAVVLATPEQPPQAQVVAQGGSLVVPPSATSLDAHITPLDPSVDAAAASTGRVLGNVYRITIVDQDGTPATAPLSALVTVVLRASEDVPGAKVGQLVGDAWHLLKSEVGFGSSYVAVVTGFGDFAVVAPPSSTSAPTAGGSAAPAGSASGGSAAPAESAAGGGGGGGGGGAPADGSVSPWIGALVLFALIAFIVVASVRRTRRGRDRR